MKRLKFLWSDGWLLAAIFSAQRAEGSATLDQVLAHGDGLNHSMFNLDELESGIARLIAAGLIREESESFNPIGEAEEWFRQFKGQKLTNVASMDWAAEKLRAERYRPGNDPRNSLPYPPLTRKRFDDAMAKYHLRMQQIFGSLKP